MHLFAIETHNSTNDEPTLQGKRMRKSPSSTSPHTLHHQPHNHPNKQIKTPLEKETNESANLITEIGRVRELLPSQPL